MNIIFNELRQQRVKYDVVLRQCAGLNLSIYFWKQVF